jgi:Mn2+/Fe2+ NRAMP family transporter
MTAAVDPAVRPAPDTLWGIFKSIGPGLILTANIVGTGELIATTRLGSQVGFTLLWFIVFSCVIKVFVQLELGRYTLAEGIGSLDALDRLPGPRFRVSWVLWLWFLMYLGSLCQMSGMIGGIAEILVEKTNTWGHRLAAAGIAAGTGALLASGRYSLVERASTVMVALFTISNLMAVGILQTTPFEVTGAEWAAGLSFRLPGDLVTAFAVFGITGVGAAELIFYPIWCVEKGYALATGRRDDSPEWTTRARGWMRVMKYDAWLSMVIYSFGTLSFYLLGAAILNRQGRVLGDVGAMSTLTHMYVEVLGSWGRWVFYVGAFMVLYSTLFVSSASNARLFADAGRLAGVFRFRTPDARTRAVRVAVVVLPILMMLVYVEFESLVTLVLIGGVAQAIMLPFLGGAALYFHYTATPAALRPSRAWTWILWGAFAAMTCVGLFQAWRLVG